MSLETYHSRIAFRFSPRILLGSSSMLVALSMACSAAPKATGFQTRFEDEAFWHVPVPGVPTAGDPATSSHKPWSYVGLSGPSHWSEISSEYRLCAEGKEQSPINIEAGVTPSSPHPELHVEYHDSHLHLVDNGHTLEEKVDPGSYLWTGKTSFELVQFHYHTPSENHLNDKTYPMELHFVHKSKTGQLAVLALFVEIGAKNPELDPVIRNIPHRMDEINLPRLQLHLAKLLPESRDYIGFRGSLTTPPCTEGVQWFVLKESIFMSQEQITAFEVLHGANSRPVQRRVATSKASLTPRS